jgi:hypothetical protein
VEQRFGNLERKHSGCTVLCRRRPAAHPLQQGVSLLHRTCTHASSATSKLLCLLYHAQQLSAMLELRACSFKPITCNAGNAPRGHGAIFPNMHGVTHWSVLATIAQLHF